MFRQGSALNAVSWGGNGPCGPQKLRPHEMVMPRSPLLSAFIHCLRTAFSVSLDLGSLGPSGQHVRILPWVAEHLFLRQQLSLFRERKTIMATERPGCQLTVAEAILRGRERARQAFGWLTIESKSCDMTGPSRHCPARKGRGCCRVPRIAPYFHPYRFERLVPALSLN